MKRKTKAPVSAAIDAVKTKKVAKPASLEPFTLFLKGLRLVSIRLFDSQTSLHIANNTRPTEVSLKVDVGHAFTKKKDGWVIVVSTGVTVEAKVPKGDPDSSRMLVAAKYHVTYASKVEPTELVVPNAIIMGSMTAWPHIRELVSGLVWRMKMPELTLPLMLIDPTTGQLMLQEEMLQAVHH